MRQRLARTHERISTLSINGLFELMYTRFMHKNTLKSLYKKTPYFIFPFAFSLYSHPLFAGDVSKTHLAPTTDTLSQNSTADPMSAPISTQATSAAPIKPAKQNSIAPEKNVTLDRKAEWSFLESEPFPQNKKMARALAEAVDLFIAANPHSPQAPKAWALMASLYEQAGDNKTALVDYLHLIYEYPNSSEVLGAQSHFLALAKKTLSSHLKTQWEALASPPTNKKTENRLALMLAGIAQDTGGVLRKPAFKEFRRFEARFPNYSNSDALLRNLAQIFEQDSHSHEALIFFREVLSAYPQSLYASDAQFQIASIYNYLRDNQRAVGAYQSLIKNYPQSEEILPALEDLSSLFSKRLGQWTLAIQTDQKIVKLFPGSNAARRALENAVDSSKQLGDFKGEASFLVALAEAFPKDRKASIDLYRAAGIYYETVKDSTQAEKLYQQYLDYPGHWYDPASWWRRHRARHRLSILTPIIATSDKNASGN